jgi:hypothetical protein
MEMKVINLNDLVDGGVNFAIADLASRSFITINKKSIWSSISEIEEDMEIVGYSEIVKHRILALIFDSKIFI